MDPTAEFEIIPLDDEERPGALLRFPFDRGLLESLRETFPRARWRAGEEAWFVPGTTAADRLQTWMLREVSRLDRHGDQKGRDAFSFDALESPYLEAGEDLVVRTPYSRTVVEILRHIPFARWDPEAKAWRMPFRAYEALRREWPALEEAARAAEPAARRARAEARRSDPLEAVIAAERRRRRYPVLLADPPPLDVPVVAEPFGVVVVEEIGPALEDPPLLQAYPHVEAGRGAYAFARWRLPTWRELAGAKPVAREDPPPGRGWRPATAEDLAQRRRVKRQTERAQATRARERERPGAGGLPQG